MLFLEPQHSPDASPLFLIFDGHALIYRAYHAFPPLTDPQGRLVNAVYGFARILLVALRDFAPQYVAVAFDSKEKTHRAEAYDQYKAHRPEMPDDLKPQIELIRQLVQALNIPQFALAGFEADDLIGTITKELVTVDASKTKPFNLMTVVVTGDRDLLQLVDEQTHVFIPARGKRIPDTEYDIAETRRQMGVFPDHIPDLKALMGDASDNIPGVPGVGPKTALTLLQEHHSLDGVYSALDADALSVSTSLKEKLLKGRESAHLSLALATIKTDAPIPFKLDACQVNAYDKEKATQLLTELNFNSLIKLLPKDEFELGVQAALF